MLPVQLTAAEEAEKSLAAVLFERTTALMASHSRAELAAMVRQSGFDEEKFHPGMFSTQELASLLVQYEDRVERGEAQPADFIPLAVFPAVRTAAEEAEAAPANELFERIRALMAGHSKGELAAMVRKIGGGGGKYGPELWEKQELVGYLVHRKDMLERDQAYGWVGLHNGEPPIGTCPHCGGTGCTGHDSATPWPETRERFRVKKARAAQRPLLWARLDHPGVKKIWADQGFAGRLVDWAATILGRELEIVRKDPGQRGFQVQPKRWAVERTLSWITAHRRLARDYETSPGHSETMIRWAMIGIMVRRLTRGRPATRPGPRAAARETSTELGRHATVTL